MTEGTPENLASEAAVLQDAGVDPDTPEAEEILERAEIPGTPEN